jgi:hemerythrin-like domain-containing protein
MDIWSKLMNEHHLIQQFLDVLEAAKVQMEMGKKPQGEFFRQALEFARLFADKYHHFKEEYLLFSLLAMKKKGEIDGQIEALRYSHEQGRNLINQIANALNNYKNGQEVATITILENLASYIAILKKHLHQEDHVFFLLAAKEILPEEQAELQNAFQKEEMKRGEKFLENMENLLRELESILI